MREVWMEKNYRGMQTYSNFALISVVKQRRRVIGCIRKDIENKVKVVSEKDNYMIMQAENKRKIIQVYANEKVHRERWKT